MSRTRSRKGKRGRSPAGVEAYWVPGERAVRELLRADPGRIKRVLMDASRRFEELRAELQAAGVSVEPSSAEALRAAAPRVESRGVLALADPPATWPLDQLLDHARRATPRRLIVALDGVVDPQNLGAVIRSCEFFGVSGLVWTKDRAVGLTPAVVRASAGASERLPLCVVTNLASALSTAREAGWWILGTVADAGDSLEALCQGDRLPEDLIVVMGSEGHGLRRLTREHCDFLATIARRGAVGSLNVSAAAAVTLAALASELGGASTADDAGSAPAEPASGPVRA